jgi:hypothetical protein
VGGEGGACGGDLADVGVQVSLRGGERSVAGNLAEDVHGDAGVGEPGESGVAEVVPAQAFVAELGDDLVPVSGVPQNGGGDATAARSGEQAGTGAGGPGGCRRTPHR